MKPSTTALHVKRTATDKEEARWAAENEMIEREHRETTERTRLMFLTTATAGC